MHAMILAAGRGERMLPLTKDRPKSLLKVAGKTLIEHQIRRLTVAGFTEIVINHGRFGEQIEKLLGDGTAFDCNISYSAEGEDVLETGGGIVRALPLLASKSFLVVNADVWIDYDFSLLPSEPDGLAHLVLVENPDHNQQGDFGLIKNRVINVADKMYTYSGIGIYSAELFRDKQPQKFPLTPLLRSASDKGLLSGELFYGHWCDIGTPERLQLIRERLEPEKN